MTPASTLFVRIAPILCLAILSGWVGLRAETGPAAREAVPIMAALDQLARRPPVAYSARRRLEGELVERGERGWMVVLTRFDPRRGLSHDVLAEGGSARIRKRALSSVLSREIDGSRAQEAKRAALSSDNYRYRLIGAPPWNQAWRNQARIELTPVRADVRLLKGTALLDSESGDLLKVEGRLAENPSFWVRDVQLARTYARFGSRSLTVELVSTARVRIFGAARLRIRNEYLSVDGRPVGDAGVTALVQSKVAQAKVTQSSAAQSRATASK